MKSEDESCLSVADATSLTEQMREGLSIIAAARREFEQAGLDLPEFLGVQIEQLRQALLEAGMPQHVIDSSPGLAPV